MRKQLLALILILFSFVAQAQKEIQPKDAAAHVGDSVVFTGAVYTGRFLTSSKDRVTLLNLGGAYPNQLITLVVPLANCMDFEEAPEKAYIKKVVRVKGKIELFNGKPQVVLYSEEQIEVISDMKEGQ